MLHTTLKICDKIIEICFYILFCGVPLILTPWNYELFEFNKMFLVYILTVVISLAWIVKILLQKKVEIRHTPLNLFLLLFLTGQVLATTASIDLHISIFGYYSRFHGGLLSSISYVILFFAFISNINDMGGLKHLKKLLFIAFCTAFFVCIYAILEHFGIDKNLWVQDVENRVFSTFGQPNWLAAYITILILPAAGMGLSLFFNFDIKNKGLNIKTSFLLLLSYLLFLTFYLALLFTKSRSGFIAFWTADLIFWLLISAKLVKTDFKLFIAKLATTNAVLLIITFLVGGASLGPLEKYSFPKLTEKRQSIVETQKEKPSGESLLETGITESGDIRKIVWQGAWDIFLHNPILGTGPETFAYSYYQFRPSRHNMTSEWDFLYNKAHNEFLNYLANTGLVGFATWMAFILSYIIWFLKNVLFNQNRKYYVVLCSLFTGWLTILVTDFFGFSVVVVSLFFFLIPAASVLLDNKIALKTFRLHYPKTILGMLIVSTILGASYLIWTLFMMWRADTFFAKGYRQNRASQYIQSYENLTKAVQLNPFEPFFADELAFTSGILSVALDKQNEATQSASVLKEQAIAISEKIALENPRNLNYVKSRIRLYYTLSSSDPKLKIEVLSSLEKAHKLSPTDPKISYNLGIVYAQAGQIENAEKYFLQTISLKPDFRDAYYGYALFLKDQGKIKEAKDNLNFILTKLIPNDQEAKKKMEEWKAE